MPSGALPRRSRAMTRQTAPGVRAARLALRAYVYITLGAFSWSNVNAATTLELVSPRGGATWAAGSYHPIRFKADVRPPLRIEYTTTAGENWTEVQAAAPVEGRILRRVPSRTS